MHSLVGGDNTCTHPKHTQITISYGDNLAMDELALYYGFVDAADETRLCAVHRRGATNVLSALSNRGSDHGGSRAEEDVGGSPYEVAREVGQLAAIVEGACEKRGEGLVRELMQEWVVG